MGSEPNGRRIALLAIQPRFADAIFGGQKKVEFRRVRFRCSVTHVVVYVSSPTRRIIGYFEVSGVVEGDPRVLWSLYKSVGCMKKNEFFFYFNKRKSGIAIEIGTITKLKRPVSLRSLDASLVPPQSFTYLRPEQFKRIANRKTA